MESGVCFMLLEGLVAPDFTTKIDAWNTKYDRALAKCSCKMRSNNQSRLILCKFSICFMKIVVYNLERMGNRNSLIGQQ